MSTAWVANRGGITEQALHTFLTTRFDLVIDPVERGNARTYFLRAVVWHPSATTRVLHIQFGTEGHVSHIKRCVSSDNNNSAFVPLPIGWPELHHVVAEEVAQHLKTRQR